MKFLRYGPPGEEKPGLLDKNGIIRDLSDKINDFEGLTLCHKNLSELAKINTDTLNEVNGTPRLGPPVANIGKIIAVGINYADHGKETKINLPKEPILFSKAITSLSGPNDPVILPIGSLKCDWEAELAIVIGKRAQYVSEKDAMQVVAGYTIMNDVSEREFQLEREGQWLKGKSFDTFAPLGPWLVTPDEIVDPQNLHIWLNVNGKKQQDGHTNDMIFNIRNIISTVTNYMTLMPGDIISTGTPPGVGLGKIPPMYLKKGDVMNLGIEGLGEQSQKIKSWEEVH
jgi:2-keto-4-pentenoate hydratase/2-oxohepta-3-ene-1,7-dioic acid hydratase in catechol pathway